MALPPELWLIIFQFATTVPASLSPLPDMHVWLNNADRIDTFAAATSTKLAIVRVCKLWWKLGVQCLYQHIELTRLAQLAPLADTLARSKQQPRYNTAPLGDRTRRIDFWTLTLDWQFPLRTPGEPLPPTEDLVRILELTPNLTIFNDRGLTADEETPSPVVDALVRTTRGSLQRLYWDFTPGPTLPDLSRLLRAAPRLRTLCLWFDGDKPPPSTNPLMGLSLPNLVVLKVHLANTWQLPTCATWHLPALTTVLFFDSRRPDDFEPLYHFLSIHGNQLRSLGFNCAHNAGPVLDVARVLSLCPSITALQYTLTRGFPPPETGHGQIADIGLHIGQHDDPPSPSSSPPPTPPGTHTLAQLDSHFDALATANRMPHLRRVHLLSFTSHDLDRFCAERAHRAWWAGWCARWKERGVRFEDGQGKLVGDVLAEWERLERERTELEARVEKLEQELQQRLHAHSPSQHYPQTPIHSYTPSHSRSPSQDLRNTVGHISPGRLQPAIPAGIEVTGLALTGGNSTTGMNTLAGNGCNNAGSSWILPNGDILGVLSPDDMEQLMRNSRPVPHPPSSPNSNAHPHHTHFGPPPSPSPPPGGYGIPPHGALSVPLDML